MNVSDSEPRYVISIAARIIGIETYTLRYYERLGLIQPFRSSGKIRYYSEGDIEHLRRIKTLVNDLGINIAGVEVIMRMSEKIRDLQQRIAELETEVDTVRQQTDLPKTKKQVKRKKDK